MDELRPDEIAARVRAWQHRDPLARRVRDAQVESIGVVALPFAAADGGGEAVPAFSEDFIAPLAPARVARFAARHAVAALPPNPATPLREVAADPLPAGQSLHHRYLLTAALEAGGQRTRVLLGPAPGAPVLGRRVPDRRRQAAAGVAAAVLLAAVLAWTARPEGTAVPTVASTATPAVAVAASAASAAPAAPAASAASAAPPARADEPVATAAATSAAAEAPAYERPPDVEPRWGTVKLPPRPQVVKPLPQRRHAAAPTAPAIPAASAAASASVAAAASAVQAAAAEPPRAVAVPPPGQVWAVSTRLVRTRAESEQLAHAMRALVGAAGEVQVEAVAVGDDWRVAAWPFLRRRDAERAQAALAARGMRAEVVAF